MARNRYVDFVSDKHFLACVKHVCDSYPTNSSISSSAQQLKRNGLDLFKAVFDIVNTGSNAKTWTKNELIRQKDKTVNNAIGEFHQMLLGGVEGWKDLGVGSESHVDLKTDDNSIFIELKNKWNTMNSGALESARRKLEKCIKKNPTAVAYWAYIVSRNGSTGEGEWVYSGRNNPQIKKVWGSKVYEMVTGDSKAMEKTLRALPLALKEILGDKATQDKKFLDDLVRQFGISG
jgi:hypothetical protein